MKQWANLWPMGILFFAATPLQSHWSIAPQPPRPVVKILPEPAPMAIRPEPQWNHVNRGVLARRIALEKAQQDLLDTRAKYGEQHDMTHRAKDRVDAARFNYLRSLRKQAEYLAKIQAREPVKIPIAPVVARYSDH
jgi:hypothetical protein